MPAQNLTSEIKNRSVWSIVMGLLTAALGVFLIVYPLATATITTVLLGWALIFVGIAQFVFALHSQTIGKFFLRAFLSVLYGFCGIALAFSPIAGVVALTALLGTLLLIHAGVATATAFQMRPVEGWGWFLFDAVASHPFKFFLVHEAQPNAFATPGGNIYVVDSLLSFVKNQEQLAGTLCHEVSHTIHHDSVTLMEKEERIKEREIGAAVLLGPRPRPGDPSTRQAAFARLQSRADLTGSDICAEAGYNHGNWCGSSRISRMPTQTSYRSSSRIIPMTSIG